MARRFSSLASVGLVLATSCSFDPTQYMASGSGGASSGAGGAHSGPGVTSSANNGSTGTQAPTATAGPTTSAGGTTSATTSTTAASTTAASTSASTTAASTTGATTSATTTTATTAVTTVSASVSTGGPTNLPFCPTGSPPLVVSDTFNPTFDPALWNPMGNVAPDGAGNVALTIQGNNMASLALKSTTDLWSGDCAITVEVVAETGGEQRLRINTNNGNYRVKYYFASGNRVLTFTGNDSPPLTAPFTIAVVSHLQTLYAGYKSGSTWTRLDGTGAMNSAFASADVLLTQENGGNGTASKWHDYDVVPVSLADLGL